MPSPFPGMNPYLEQEDVWQDFHNTFIVEARGAIVSQLSERYYAKVEERLYIHEVAAEERRFFGVADVGVRDVDPTAGDVATGGVIGAPVALFVPTVVDYERNLFIEIRAITGDEVITAIELLSPTNKRRGGHRDQYLAKRDALLHSPTHLVEIDLLRGGPRMPIDGLPACAYYAMVSRADQRPRASGWTVGLRDPLPTIPIPLRGDDSNVSLDIQQIVHRTYDAAVYGRIIYAGQPQPPLQPDDAAWAESVLRDAGVTG